MWTGCARTYVLALAVARAPKPRRKGQEASFLRNLTKSFDAFESRLLGSSMARGLDTSAKIGYWKEKLEKVIRGEEDPAIPTGVSDALQASRTSVLAEPLVTVPPTERGFKEGVTEAIGAQRTEVKDAFGRRRDTGKPCEPDGKGKVRQTPQFDSSKLQKMEADMKKKFADKVAMPEGVIRPSRVDEHSAHHVRDFCRGNELFDKRDFYGAAAEFSTSAVEAPHLLVFALINRGNAYKALGLSAEAISCYQNAMDEAPPVRSPDGRLLHSCALNNLGAACQDDGRMEQALQYFASAVALNPRCNLALKNRANLHLTHAEALQRSANVPALVPPQHELSYGYYGQSLEQDWHLPVVFPVAHGVLVRLDARITSQLEESSDKLGRNVSYHFTTNLTHATSAHV